MSQIPEKYSWMPSVEDEKMYIQLINQVKKDFELTGLTIYISEVTSPETLINVVANELYQLVQYRFDVFMQLLYRVDVAERIMQTNEVESSEVLTQKATYELLKREWQKVELRMKSQ